MKSRKKSRIRSFYKFNQIETGLEKMCIFKDDSIEIFSMIVQNHRKINKSANKIQKNEQKKNKDQQKLHIGQHFIVHT